MTREERQGIYDNVEGFIVIAGFISLVVMIFAGCNLYSLSNEHIDGAGSHLFHSVLAGIGSAGCAFGGQIWESIPLAADSFGHFLDFFDASARQAAHDRSVANTEDVLLWSSVIFLFSFCVIGYHKQLEQRVESLLASL